MRILVTGGCGFIGSAVVRLAVERGDQVLNLDRRRKSQLIPALVPIAGREGYARIEADIADRGLIRAMLREFAPDAVIHLAACGEDDPTRLFDGEAGGAFSVLEASRSYFEKLSGNARDRFRIVHAVHAQSDIPETPTPAQAMRAGAAAMMESWSHAHGLPLATCVAGEVFGPWQPNTSFFARLVGSILHGRSLVLGAGGETVRDWLPIRDFASGILRCAEAAPPLSRFDFSVGAERADIDLARSVCSLLDERSPLPNGASWAGLISTEGDASTASPGPMLDCTEAERDLGWEPLGFHAGLDRLLTWSLASLAAQAARRPAIAAE
jgi:dTDP-glucose 4,6-dehydratase